MYRHRSIDEHPYGDHGIMWPIVATKTDTFDLALKVAQSGAANSYTEYLKTVGLPAQRLENSTIRKIYRAFIKEQPTLIQRWIDEIPAYCRLSTQYGTGFVTTGVDSFGSNHHYLVTRVVTVASDGLPRVQTYPFHLLPSMMRRWRIASGRGVMSQAALRNSVLSKMGVDSGQLKVAV